MGVAGMGAEPVPMACSGHWFRVEGTDLEVSLTDAFSFIVSFVHELSLFHLSYSVGDACISVVSVSFLDFLFPRLPQIVFLLYSIYFHFHVLINFIHLPSLFHCIFLYFCKEFISFLFKDLYHRHKNRFKVMLRFRYVRVSRSGNSWIGGFWY